MLSVHDFALANIRIDKEVVCSEERGSPALGNGDHEIKYACMHARTIFYHECMSHVYIWAGPYKFMQCRRV